MLLLGSLAISRTSADGVIAFSASPVLGKSAALNFVVSAFVGVCAAEAGPRVSHRSVSDQQQRRSEDANPELRSFKCRGKRRQAVFD